MEAQDRIGWTVYDAIDGRPICLGRVTVVGLTYEDASEMTNALNRQDLEIERVGHRLVTQRRCSRGVPPIRAPSLHRCSISLPAEAAPSGLLAR